MVSKERQNKNSMLFKKKKGITKDLQVLSLLNNLKKELPYCGFKAPINILLVHQMIKLEAGNILSI